MTIQGQAIQAHHQTAVINGAMICSCGAVAYLDRIFMRHLVEARRQILVDEAFVGIVGRLSEDKAVRDLAAFGAAALSD